MEQTEAIRNTIDQLYAQFTQELPPATHSFGSYKDVMVPMRDGVRLMTRVLLPEGEGPWPVIVSRNPYTPVNDEKYMFLAIFLLIEYGYAVVYQQVRGVYASEGQWYPFEREREDGIELLKWTAAQEWCDGRIGSYGGSYLGHVQMCLADELIPEVRSMYTLVWGDDPYGSFYENGMFKEGTWTLWATQMMNPRSREDLSIPDMAAYEKAIEIRPHCQIPQKICGVDAPWYQNWIHSNGRGDEYWNSGCWGKYASIAEKIKVPVLMQTGWYDIFFDSTVSAFHDLSEETRNKSRLIIGPWHHGNTTGGGLPCPNENRFGTFQVRLALEWFDATIKGRGTVENRGLVTAYDVGAGCWRDFYSAISSDRKLTLYAGAEASGIPQAMSLSSAPASEGKLSFIYDPNDPVPSRGGKLLTNYNDPQKPCECSVEQQKIGERSDVLSFVSHPFEKGLCLMGEAKVKLSVSSDAADTAFTVKLMELRRDGKAYNIRDAISTLAYRYGDDKAVAYTAGDIVELRIDLGELLWTLSPDSCIRLDISSSNFPAFHVHPNKAGCWADQTEYAVARQTVFFGEKATSITLSVGDVANGQ